MHKTNPYFMHCVHIYTCILEIKNVCDFRDNKNGVKSYMNSSETAFSSLSILKSFCICWKDINSAWQWPECYYLGFRGGCKYEHHACSEMQHNLQVVHANMNLWQTGWALPLRRIQAHQHVMGLLTLPLKSQTLFDKVAFEGPTQFPAATGPWKIAYIYSFNVCIEMFFPHGRQIRSMYKKYTPWPPIVIASTLSTILLKSLWIYIHRKRR